MALLKFFEGKEGSYSSSSHSGGLYFAKDTGVILFKGIRYGGQPDLSGYANKSDISSLQGQISKKANIDHTHKIKDISDLILANSDRDGLMPSSMYEKLDNLVGDKSIVKKVFFNKTSRMESPNNTLSHDIGVENNKIGLLFSTPLVAMYQQFDDPTGDPNGVGTILVTMLNADISRNGYMTSTQASQLQRLYTRYGNRNYLSISEVGTVTENVAFEGRFRINMYPLELMGEGLEIYHKTPFIDFHYNKSSTDYTSRIIETSSGVLNINEVLLSNGQVTATKVNQTSDIRLKENISTIVEDTDKIKDVKFFEFNHISDKNKTKSYGVIAQDLEEVGLKNLVIEDADGYKSVDYNALLILEIQRLRNEIDILKSKIS